MPEVHVQKQSSDNVLTEDDKMERIEELRKKIEGKFDELIFICDKYCLEFNATNKPLYVIGPRNIQRVVQHETCFSERKKNFVRQSLLKGTSELTRDQQYDEKKSFLC